MYVYCQSNYTIARNFCGDHGLSIDRLSAFGRPGLDDIPDIKTPRAVGLKRDACGIACLCITGSNVLGRLIQPAVAPIEIKATFCEPATAS